MKSLDRLSFVELLITRHKLVDTTQNLHGISGNVAFLISIKYIHPLSDELVHALKLHRYYFKSYQIIVSKTKKICATDQTITDLRPIFASTRVPTRLRCTKRLAFAAYLKDFVKRSYGL